MIVETVIEFCVAEIFVDSRVEVKRTGTMNRVAVVLESEDSELKSSRTSTNSIGEDEKAVDCCDACSQTSDVLEMMGQKLSRHDMEFAVRLKNCWNGNGSYKIASEVVLKYIKGMIDQETVCRLDRSLELFCFDGGSQVAEMMMHQSSEHYPNSACKDLKCVWFRSCRKRYCAIASKRIGRYFKDWLDRGIMIRKELRC